MVDKFEIKYLDLHQRGGDRRFGQVLRAVSLEICLGNLNDQTNS